MSTSLFLAQLAADSQTGEYSEADWASLLRVFHAFEAYNRSYSIQVQPSQVLNLLTTDPLLAGLVMQIPGQDSIGSGVHRPRPRCQEQRRRCETGRPHGGTDPLRMARLAKTATSCCGRCWSTAGSCTIS